MMVLNIAAFELRRLFASPLAWVILAVLQFLAALFFYVLLSRYLEAGQGQAERGITASVAAGMLQFAGILMLVLTPFLTMRTFSEDRRNGTLQLLLSAPVSITELVLGKYLGVLAFLGLAAGLIVLMPLSLLPGVSLDPGLLAAGVFGLLLLAAAFTAIGLFVATLTAQPAVAAIATFGVLFVLWVIHLAASSATGVTATILSWLSLLGHFNPLLQGLVSSVDLAYFAIMTGLFILLSIWRLDAARSFHW